MQPSICANPDCGREFTQRRRAGARQKYCRPKCHNRWRAKKPARSELTVARMREIVDYDPITGVLVWRARPLRPGIEHTDKGWNTRCAGKPAGRPGKHGHIYIAFVHGDAYGTANYAAHRVAWAHYHGEWPERDIDHINGVPSDNRIGNLRLCTETQNLANAKLRKNNTSGVKGVYWDKKAKRWSAFITIDKRVTNLGRFETKELAIAARQGMAAHVFGDFARETPISEELANSEAS